MKFKASRFEYSLPIPYPQRAQKQGQSICCLYAYADWYIQKRIVWPNRAEAEEVSAIVHDLVIRLIELLVSHRLIARWTGWKWLEGLHQLRMDA